LYGPVEIPDLPSLPEIHDEPVFDGYCKGGCSLLGRDGGHKKIPKASSLCRSGVRQLEDILEDIFSCLSFIAGTANIPKIVVRNDDTEPFVHHFVQKRSLVTAPRQARFYQVRDLNIIK
jgi:hypothetical protein